MSRSFFLFIRTSKSVVQVLIVAFLFTGLCGVYLGTAQGSRFEEYDFSKDNKIDEKDLVRIIRLLRQRDISIDFNGDGRVDALDIFLFSRMWNLREGYLQLPPDPSDVIPSPDSSVPTDIYETTRFIYEQDSPIQRDVSGDVIEARRVAVVRGKVMTRAGDGLPGVRISVLGRPEFGYTYSREDGVFDLVVNGGGPLTICYEKEGFLPAQRRIEVPWRDFVWLPDVVLITLDTQVTRIDFSDPVQVARGSVIEDEDGGRQGTLLFFQDTNAQMRLPDGALRPIPEMHVRLTEFTVGANGPQAMPAELPPTSGYTYCVEVSADEVLAAGGEEVRLDPPGIFYVENFIDFPVGSAVPTGYYDRKRGVWVASENGRVVEILAVENGRVKIDIDGDGVAENTESLADFGISEAELRALASLYEAGQTLWRVAIDHFTPWDCNWPYGPPKDAKKPEVPDPDKYDRKDNPCGKQGSILDIHNQALGKSIPVAGTPFSIHYDSNQVLGRWDYYWLEIFLSGDEIPESLLRILLRIEIAGSRYERYFPPRPNLVYEFRWDGVNEYGIPLQGPQQIKVSIGYVYRAEYYAVPSEFERSFARFGAVAISGGGAGGGAGAALPGAGRRSGRANSFVTIWKRWSGTIGSHRDARTQGFGGWTLSIHHSYNASDRAIYLGSGEKRSGAGMNIENIIAPITKPHHMHESLGDDGPAIEATLNSPWGIDVGPDGSVYVADGEDNRIRKIDPDGQITTVAGTGGVGNIGDGEPATMADLWYPVDIAVGPDGSLFIVDQAHYRLRRVGPDGTITTITGDGYIRQSGDGGPAENAQISKCRGIAVGPDGSIYFSDGDQIRQIGTDGIITTMAGAAAGGHIGEGSPAIQTRLSTPWGVDVGPDGSLYVCNYKEIIRIGLDGIVSKVAGGRRNRNRDDGIPAVEAFFDVLPDVEVAQDGTVYIADMHGNRIRAVDSAGIIRTVAGTGSGDLNSPMTEPGPATAFDLYVPKGIALSPQGHLYIVDSLERVLEMRPPFPGYSLTDVFFPSKDGDFVYVFDYRGRHLKTLDALTGAEQYVFSYDSNGLLSEILDGDGNATRIERNETGDRITIISPEGIRTTLSLNADGYLETLVGPEDEIWRFTYTDSGLLTSITGPEGNTWRYEYDDLGRLMESRDPGGGVKRLTRHEENAGYSVVFTDATERTTLYSVDKTVTGEEIRATEFPCGARTEAVYRTDGTVQVLHADGTVSQYSPKADPRFGLASPLVKSMKIITPSGLTFDFSEDAEIALRDTLDPMSVENWMLRRTVNGQAYITEYDAQQNQLVTTSPEGRQVIVKLDAQGRAASLQIVGLATTQFTYDEKGRLRSMTQGTGERARVARMAYNDRGTLSAFTDPLLRTTRFDRRPAGLINKMILPHGGEVSFTYNNNHRLTSLSPPGRPPHRFTYTSSGLFESYIPTGADEGEHLLYTYDQNQDVVRIDLPGGKQIVFEMEESGCTNSRPKRIITPDGELRINYGPGGFLPTEILSSDGKTLSFEYDGPLMTRQTWAGEAHGTVSWTYNNNYLISSRTVNDAFTLPLKYDRDGLLIQNGDLQLNRDPQTGFISSTVLQNVTDEWRYNEFGEVTDYSLVSQGEALYSVSYDRDAIGRIVSKIEILAGRTVRTEYAYSPAGFITGVTVGDSYEEYTYDLNGNRLAKETSSEWISGAYDEQDRLIQYGDVVYSYTPNGELESRIGPEGTTLYRYDAFGNLLEVILPDGTVIEYIIDAWHRRIGKKVNGELVAGYLYGKRLNLLAELDENGDISSVFVYGSLPNSPDYMIKEGSTYRFVHDEVGSPRLIVDAITGAVVQEISYDVFGKVVDDTNPGFQPFGFAGGLYDRDTGLARFGAREYDPETGRWTRRDPAGFASRQTNLYAYASNDPVNRIDPYGLGYHAVDLIDDAIPMTWTSLPPAAQIALTVVSPLWVGVWAPAMYAWDELATGFHLLHHENWMYRWIHERGADWRAGGQGELIEAEMEEQRLRQMLRDPSDPWNLVFGNITPEEFENARMCIDPSG